MASSWINSADYELANNSERSGPSDYSKRKRRKIDTDDNQVQDVTKCRTRWNSEQQVYNYSIKLVDALCRRRNPPNSPITSNISVHRGPTVKRTADTVLAASARGRTRWSRSILSNRLSRLNLVNYKRHPKVKLTGEIRPKKKKKKRLPLPPFQRKVQVLGTLVPGCRNLSIPNILDEAADYIAALEMQVRAMNAIAGILTGAGTLTDHPNSQSILD